MINRAIDKINQRSRSYRKKLSLGLSLFAVLIIFGIWATDKGLLKSNDPVISKKKADSAQLANVSSAPSPVDTSKQAVGAVFGEISKLISDFNDSVSSVLVPFVTGIEVYQRN